MSEEIIKIFLQIKTEIQELSIARKEVFSLHDFTIYAGISLQQGYKITSANKIKFYRSGGGKRIYIKRQDAISYLLKNPVENHAEVAQKANNIITPKTTL